MTLLNPRSRRVLASLLSVLILSLIFWALFQIDLPLARFMRSVHLPMLERIGDVGTSLGSGLVLVVISVVIAAGGLLRRHLELRLTGIQTLIAHGVAALITQGLKHTVGRPRPRLLHGTEGFPWGPSFDAGLDSFPSGHTTASFAVATVIAQRFPRTAWLVYALAGFVAVSRVVRGSHFPTDIAAGLCLGMLIGAIVVHPLRFWRQSAMEATVAMLPPLLGLLTVLWLASHSRGTVEHHIVAVLVGAVAMVAGFSARVYYRVQGQCAPSYAAALIVLALAITTRSFLIMGLVVLVCLVYTLHGKEMRMESSSAATLRLNVFHPYQWRSRMSTLDLLLHEVPVAIGLVLAMLAIQQISGMLPIL